MTTATKIYRDNFVYNINTPLCEKHASKIDLGMYAIIETYSGNDICEHCRFESRRLALEANRIHWTCMIDGRAAFESHDRHEFWALVRQLNALIRDVDYKIVEVINDTI